MGGFLALRGDGEAGSLREGGASSGSLEIMHSSLVSQISSLSCLHKKTLLKTLEL